ncbi:outer membrane protein [Pelagibacterium lentulum]|uniref:HEAT resistant agglutinin 1 protein n=1 Tax=Pelagibacterium lentulum TaxID=2029865 RepID=A0A916RJ62_9HYPH|nr:porin family protein [Pelagibacterium lentulum]GGA57832.1 HEAT resistant agglutinin 1 protein [Pelagibacterium lentulum]
MRKLVACSVFGLAAVFAGSALAADPIQYNYPVYKDYVPPYVPDVDYGLKGSFYLRGSVGGNLGWAKEVNHPDFDPAPFPVNEFGYGYSAGVGAGYETGDGFRFDVTVDYLQNRGMAINVPNAGATWAAGDYSLNLRSTIALANAYYDFGLGDLGLSAAGGMFGYLGVGAGVAFNDMDTSEPGGVTGPRGSNTSFAAAGMAGVGYDFGSVVADLGYRGLYINKIENTSAPHNYSIDHALIHEVRATLRYRFN